MTQDSPDKPKVGDIWYRYCDRLRASFDWDGDARPGSVTIQVELKEYSVVRCTPKGVWLARRIGSWTSDAERFVLLSARKRFACPTKEQAVESFKARKRRQIRILSTQMNRAERAIDLIEGNNPLLEIVK